MTQPVVNVDTLPGDDVYPDLIDSNAASIRKAGAAVAHRGTRVNAHWKKLSAHYGAPETHTLVAKLEPAEKKAATFGHRMGTAATALEAFAEDARGIKKRAEAIRARAKTFLEGVVAHGVTKQTYIPSSAGGGYTKVDHERWDQDSDAVAENDAIIGEIEQLANDLEAAEATCADAITAAVGAEPVTGPGTSIDWTALPAGTATPWGTEMGHRNENNDEAVGRGILTGMIGLETSLLALQGWQNKTMTYDNLKNGTFDPWGLEHSFKLQGRSLLGVGQFAAGLGNLVNPVYAPLTLLSLNAKGPVGDYSRATTGVTINGAKSFVAWDKWKDDPYAAGGEAGFNLLTLAIPGAGEAAPAEIAARVGVRAGEEAVTAGGRAGLDAAAGTARAGTEAGADAAARAARGGSHLPAVLAGDARTALGHAVEPPLAGRSGSVYRAGDLGRAADDFSLREPPVVDTPAPRRPSGVDLPDPVHRRIAAESETRHSSPGAREGSPTHPQRELVHAGAPERPAGAEARAGGPGDHGPGSDHDVSSVSSTDALDQGRGGEAGHEASHAAPPDHGGPWSEEGARRRPRARFDVEQQEGWATEVYRELLDDPSAGGAMVDNLSDVERATGRRGFDQAEVDQVLRHVMDEEHPLEDLDGTVVSRRFDPSADMADAFLRIRDGRPRASDLVLMEHELAESSYMRSTGAGYREAHLFANEQFNWERALDEGGH